MAKLIHRSLCSMIPITYVLSQHTCHDPSILTLCFFFFLSFSRYKTLFIFPISVQPKLIYGSCLRKPSPSLQDSKGSKLKPVKLELGAGRYSNGTERKKKKSSPRQNIIDMLGDRYPRFFKQISSFSRVSCFYPRSSPRARCTDQWFGSLIIYAEWKVTLLLDPLARCAFGR